MKEVLDFYQIRQGDLTPNSVLMLFTFAYLCEAFLRVKPSVVLWRHFFILRLSGGTATTYGSCRFQTRSNPRTDYIITDFNGRWESWKESWFFLRTEPNRRLRVLRRVTRGAD
jgi:hypothetical protein